MRAPLLGVVVAVLAGCAAPTPNEVRAVQPVYQVSAQPKSKEFCECLIREADERVMIGVIPTPIPKRLIPAGAGCELIVGSSVPFAILRANNEGAQIRLMRDIERRTDFYIGDAYFQQITDGLRDSIGMCFGG